LDPCPIRLSKSPIVSLPWQVVDEQEIGSRWKNASPAFSQRM
jgi:hypothetical protein